MAMNRFMHPRNPYKTPPDFKQLALDYPEFREKAIQNLSGHVRLDFRNEGSVWALTKSLLHKDFKLKVEIIPDRLVPTLPLRLNYLLWLEDLLNFVPGGNEEVVGVDIDQPLSANRPSSEATLVEFDYVSADDPLDKMMKNGTATFPLPKAWLAAGGNLLGVCRPLSDGVVISKIIKKLPDQPINLVLIMTVSPNLPLLQGTGACCIYPLLAWKHLSWKMLATETDEKSYECAQQNIDRNNLQGVVTVKLVPSDSYLVGALEEDKSYSFCMCNPPFHKDNVTPKSRHPDRHGPRNAPTGTKVEVSVSGGEEAFVSRIIEDSALLKTKIGIYTVMLGHKSSVAPLKQKAIEAGAADVASSVFCQGRTTRWGFAWTFHTHYKISLLKSPFEMEKRQQKANQPFTHDFLQDEGFTYDLIVSRLIQLLENLEIKCVKEEDDDGIYILGIDAAKNTWINSRKRRREEKRRAAELQTEKANGSQQPSPVDTESSVQPEPDTKVGQIMKPEPSDDPSSSPKKVKTELGSVDVKDKTVSVKCVEIEKISESYLKALITILELDDAVKLEILYIGGSAGRDTCNQLLVYLKGHIKGAS